MTAPGGARPERWDIRVHDRPASVERVLGTLRRRRVQVDDLTVSRSSDTAMAVVVEVRVPEPVGARVCGELLASPDVIAVENDRWEKGEHGPREHERTDNQTRMRSSE